jgi:hypothetical protein
VVFEFPRVKKKPNVLRVKPLRLYRNPIGRAQEWQRALVSGEYSSPADLSRKLGVSRARVAQVLRVLRLSPKVVKTVAALGDPLPSPVVTERRLRPIVQLPRNRQWQEVRNMLSRGKRKP